MTGSHHETMQHEPAVQYALEAFRASGSDHRNCAQTVLLYAVKRLGAEESEIERARYLGGGIARFGLTCGAITGAALALATRDGETSPEHLDESGSYQQLREIIADFERNFDHTACADLTECDISTRQGYRRFREQRVRETHCEGYVSWVCGRLQQAL